MPKTYDDRRVVIPRNEESNPDASIEISTNVEDETVSVRIKQWQGIDGGSVTIPKQFIRDLVSGLQDVGRFVGETPTDFNPPSR